MPCCKSAAMQTVTSKFVTDTYPTQPTQMAQMDHVIIAAATVIIALLMILKQCLLMTEPCLTQTFSEVC